jgi:MoxR-like ATPase
MIYNPASSQFTVKKAPSSPNSFSLTKSIVPRQSAKRPARSNAGTPGTIGGETHILKEPFLVLATQNPIEQEGTYNLPEAQVDRFMFKVKIGYPERNEERMIMQRALTGETNLKLQPVVHTDDILRARKTVRKVYMDEKIENYILDIVFATRQPDSSGSRRSNRLFLMVLHHVPAFILF